jgi:DNA-binding response OmpR family regulator
LTSAAWKLDRNQQRLHSPNGGLINLTENESELITLFANSGSANIDKKVLIEALGKETSGSYEVILSRLRKKVKNEVGLKLPVRTQYGRGYQWYEKIQLTG